MSAENPRQAQARGRPVLDLQQIPYQQQPAAPTTSDDLHYQQPHASSAQHKAPAQQHMQHMQQTHHAAGMWAAGSLTRSYTHAAASAQGAGVGGMTRRHSSPAPAAQQQHPLSQLSLPTAYSRLSIAGDAVADAQRQTDQAPAAGAAAAGVPGGPAGLQEYPQVPAWAMQRALAARSMGGGGNQHPASWAAAAAATAVGMEVDAEKPRAQADQHVQGQDLSIEVRFHVQPPDMLLLQGWYKHANIMMRTCSAMPVSTCHTHLAMNRRSHPTGLPASAPSIMLLACHPAAHHHTHHTRVLLTHPVTWPSHVYLFCVVTYAACSPCWPQISSGCAPPAH
jgi:hypothetical protein